MEKRRALASGIRSEACGEKQQAADQEKYLQISRPTKDSYLEELGTLRTGQEEDNLVKE